MLSSTTGISDRDLVTATRLNNERHAIDKDCKLREWHVPVCDNIGTHLFFNGGKLS